MDRTWFRHNRFKVVLDLVAIEQPFAAPWHEGAQPKLAFDQW